MPKRRPTAPSITRDSWPSSIHGPEMEIILGQATKRTPTSGADAIRKRFTRAVGKLTGAIIAEFPELLEAVPRLKSDKV